MPELIDKNTLICKFCNECQHCTRIAEMGGEPTMCKTVMMIAEMPTIEAEPARIIPKEVSATDLDKLTEMIKSSLLQAYPNDAMFTAVRHGRWIDAREQCDCDGIIRVYLCSECGMYVYIKFDFCPYCGAKMESEVQDDVKR